ncbi:MAG: hypothetical protein JXB36_16205, partial [Gammaproteobacteria bacterium]|nr:hypothetical protein [Gammaproteobacteria bacterium]
MLSGATSEAPLQIPQAAAGKPLAAARSAPPQPDDTGVEAGAAREAAPDPQSFPAALAAAGVLLNVEAPGAAVVGGEAAGSGAKTPTAQALPQSGKTLPLLPLAQGDRLHFAPPLPT